ncbi:Clp protease N-terminal domain-containing protein [Streptomyces sp. ODS28]|uniref:Clp protease N-terminal domain-containing protein n=1 Tax=Streptomyces sp. ODS28 TaxID=3136688 RepID=UPI0031EF24D8
MVNTARRRAARDGDRQIDTAHLLHSLLESDREVWDLLDGGAGGAGAVEGGGGATATGGGGAGPADPESPPSSSVSKLLGYLVQRSIGYGLRWQNTVEDSGAVPAIAEQPGGVAGWSPAVTAAMDAAASRMRARGAESASGADLFAGLLADEDCRAVEVLRRAGIDLDAVAGRLREAERQDREDHERDRALSGGGDGHIPGRR